MLAKCPIIRLVRSLVRRPLHRMITKGGPPLVKKKITTCSHKRVTFESHILKVYAN